MVTAAPTSSPTVCELIAGAVEERDLRRGRALVAGERPVDVAREGDEVLDAGEPPEQLGALVGETVPLVHVEVEGPRELGRHALRSR